MAELIGVVSAGFGIASFALQLSDTINALRQVKNGEVEKELGLLSKRLEFIQQILGSLESFEELPAVSAAITESHRMHEQLEQKLQRLLAKLPPDCTHLKSRFKTLKLAFSPSLKQDIEKLEDRANAMISQLTLAIALTQVNLSELKSLKQQAHADAVACSRTEIDNQSTEATDTIQDRQGAHSTDEINKSLGKSVIPTRRDRHHVCGARHCACSCHLTRVISKRFWGIEFTPISVLLKKPTTSWCDSRWFRFQLRVALSQYGIPRAIILGIDFALSSGGITLRPALQTQVIVNYTSPGFEAIWRCKHELISVEDACAKLVALSRSDPTFKYHRDPGGNNYVQKLLCGGPWGGMIQKDQFRLLGVLCREIGISLENEDQTFLIKCAQWIGEGWHLNLLESILEYGFDPTMIHCPLFEDWPTSCSPDWPSERHTPDPFFIQYITSLVHDNPGFAGSSPLHNAILAGSVDAVKTWANRTEPVDNNVNFLGQTPLHLAIGNPMLLDLILEVTQNLDKPDNWGTTPLMYALGTGCAQSTKRLIESGASLLLRDNKRKAYRRNFLDYAFSFGHWDLILYVLEIIEANYGRPSSQAFGKYALMYALKAKTLFFEERKAFVLQLIARVDDVTFTFRDAHNETDDNNLMHYVYSLDEAEALHASGFKGWNQPNSKGELALNSLARNPDPLIIKFCLEHGTDINHVTTRWRNVLFTLLPNIESSGWKIWDAMDSLALILDAGIDMFSSDDCNCPCSPHGCDIASVFDIGGHSSDWISTLGLLRSPWDLELFSLIEEHYGIDKSRRFLLSLFRKLKCQEEATCITHVCCHRGKGTREQFPWVFFTKQLRGEDISEILVEEAEFINALELDMEVLRLESVERLKSKWIAQLGVRYNQCRSKEAKTPEEDDCYEKGPFSHLSYRVNYKADEYMIHTGDTDYDSRHVPSSLPLAGYALWLEHERSRAGTSPFYNLHKPGWYERRIEWVVELMNSIGICEEEIATQVSKRDIRESKTELVDAAATAAAFLKSIRARKLELL
ncbi:hypothetical protein HD806DRAFT_508770 [Xylariaceae sp. AK1471]|nr:hypothetical protein HD806DRAFT_508770 [Xylariaceae sp. AK1471]